ncbi:transglycosylase domain-containing protein [Nocardioides sp.]|uniref:transglycosylase domain-containing protein n=1 Tax=Nocardioides sp. TaxID=35761 RepID=UPI003529B923
MAKRRASGPAVTKSPTRTRAAASSGGSSKKPGKSAPAKGRWKRRILKTFAWLTVLGLLGVIFAAGAFVYVYNKTEIPDPNSEFLTQTTQVFYADGKTPLGTFATQDRESIPLKKMPQTLQDAVVSAEDRTFWTNKGIDPKGIIRAAFNNAKGGSVQGASTITQQYVKILYLTSERSLQRKVKEAMLSLKLQREYSKQEILEGYLNTIYFGRGAYGVQAAAQAYFQVDAKDLDLQQSAVLASVLNNPTAFDPANGKDAKLRLKERYAYVLDGMAQMGNLSQADADEAAKHLPDFPKIEVSSKNGGQNGFMLALVREELHTLGYTDQQIDGGGLKVTTTFTKEAMRAARQGVVSQRPTTTYDGQGKINDKNLHAAAATVQVGTGALLGFYGGQNFLQSQINWAVAGGMVGSTMKPFTLAAALEQGFALKDTFEGNSPYVFPDGLEVKNEGAGDGNDYGSHVTATKALEESINTAFIDMSVSMDDGPAAIDKMANELGVPPAKANDKYPGIPSTSRDLSPDDTLITLGKARISPINMANAYASIASGGERAQVHVIQSVDARSDVADDYTFKSPTKRVLDKDIAADVSYAMQQVVDVGTGTAAKELARPAGGKTGTATKEAANGGSVVSSAWFVGFTPQISTAVMYVRGDGDDQLDTWLPSYFGGSYPARTWTAIMKADMEGLPVEEFPPPAYVDGEAPSNGHDPYTPPPPKPTKTKTKTPSDTPTPTPSDTPTPTPTPDPDPDAIGQRFPQREP